MVTSPSEWRILEWDDKPQTNKQTCEMPLLTFSLYLTLTCLLLFLQKDSIPNPAFSSRLNTLFASKTDKQNYS